MAKAKTKKAATADAAPKVTVRSVVSEFMGDPNMSSAQIAEVVRERIPGAATSAKSVASTLANLRKEHGEEAAPKRAAAQRASDGNTLGAWLSERLLSVGNNKEVAEEASAHFGRAVCHSVVASYRSKLRGKGVAVVPSRVAKAAPDA